jgi:glycosyltransferase involved in cell wall biosynthesis
MFLFVDDASVDNTAKLLHKLKEQNTNQVAVLQLSKNQGKGKAIREGVLFVQEKLKFIYIGFIDADLAIPLYQIDNLLGKIEENDYTAAITSRYMDSKQLVYDQEPTFFRKRLSDISRLLVFFMFQGKITDSQCGCKLFKAESIGPLFEKPFISSWLFDIEILKRLKRNNEFKVVEVQLDKLNRNGVSKLGKKQIFTLFFDFLKIIFRTK